MQLGPHFISLNNFETFYTEEVQKSILLSLQFPYAYENTPNF